MPLLLLLIITLLSATVNAAEGGDPGPDMINTIHVINAGKGGHNSRNLLQRFGTDAAAHKPDLVILGAGTNDAINSSNSVPLRNYEETMRELIAGSRAIGAAVIAITSPPCMDAYVLERHPAAFFKGQSPNARVREYKDALVRLCQKEHVPVIDLYQLFQERGSLGDTPESWLQNPANSKRRDGVHPTETGYTAIAQAVRDVIAKLPGRYRTIVCLGDSITFGAGARNSRKDHSYPAQLQELLSPPSNAPSPRKLP